jgi:REP element-mobilizing transposase RayT
MIRPGQTGDVGARFIAPGLTSSLLHWGAMNCAPTTPAFNSDLHHRRSIRLHNYDYSQAGAYFFTLCTQNRECLFGTVVEDTVRLNDVGRMVQEIWRALPDYYPGVELDNFVVMPNHIHGIVLLNDVGARFIAPNNGQGTENKGAINRAPAVGEIIRAFKARCTRGINQLRGLQGASIWQRNYYEHVIRNESSFHEIREYIVNNPARWAMDRENPEVVGAQFIAPNRGENVGARFIAPNNDDAENQGAMNRAPTGGEA